MWYRVLQSESSLVNFHNYLAPNFVMFRGYVSFSVYFNFFYIQYKMGLILQSLKFFCVEMGLFLFSPPTSILVHVKYPLSLCFTSYPFHSCSFIAVIISTAISLNDLCQNEVHAGKKERKPQRKEQRQESQCE